MHEDLLGYLLGALEPHEMQRIEALLRQDPDARAELARIERSLRPLDETRGPDELPPPDLVSRTLAILPPLPQPGRGAGEWGNWEAGETPVRPGSGGPPVSLKPMREETETVGGHPRRWFDWFAAAVASAILLGLLLPSLAEGRFEARKVACQDQLRELGTALTEFVLRSDQERLPPIAESGPEAFAGVYAVRLHDAGLLSDPTLRWCPSLNRPDARTDWTVIDDQSDEWSSVAVSRLVSADELRAASVNELQAIQQHAGGHYAYTLGVVDGQRYEAPRYQGRTSFAVMSDAPLGGFPQGGLTPNRIGHGGRGINVLYENGRVRFIPARSIDVMPDHPLLNLRGEVEAGVNVDDAVLAPSWRPPFVDARQR